jgi:probable HAF family extracellular repeat protein
VFLWENGKMTDLGTLGGTIVGVLECANNRGQVTGSTTLAGNLVQHAFLWERGVMHDLGTLGGDNSSPVWLNEAGEVIGDGDLPGSESHHAFLSRNGVMTDLGTLGSTSHAEAINSKGQVVGRSRIGAIDNPLQHAFLWEHGGPMVDLNTLIPANSSLELEEAFNINDRGEITGLGSPSGVPPSSEGVGLHTFLLIPCGEGTEGCGDTAQRTTVSTQVSPAPAARTSTVTPSGTSFGGLGMLDRLRARRLYWRGALDPKAAPMR